MLVFNEFCSVYAPANCEDVLNNCDNQCTNVFQCAQLYSALLKQTAAEINAEKAPVVIDLIAAKEQGGVGRTALLTTYKSFHDVEAALLFAKANLAIDGPTASPYANLGQTAFSSVTALETATLERKDFFFTLFETNSILDDDPENEEARAAAKQSGCARRHYEHAHDAA